MTEQTCKLSSWRPQLRPVEGEELQASRQLICEVVFGLYYEKTELLTKMGMPPQPVHLSEIYKRVESKVQILQQCRQWRFPNHEKRWWDRRVNEAACIFYSASGTPKIVAVSAGWYKPNQKMFQEANK